MFSRSVTRIVKSVERFDGVTHRWQACGVFVDHMYLVLTAITGDLRARFPSGGGRTPG